MAAKRHITGYVHGVSAKKKSKSFRFEVQCNGTTDFKKAICFDLSKHETLLEKENSGEAIKLENIIINSEYYAETHHAEIILNKLSVIDDVKFLNFKKVQTEIAFCDLSTKLKLGDLISIKASVDLTYIAERTIFAKSRFIEVMNNVYIYDFVGSSTLSIWDDWIPFIKEALKKGNNYFRFCQLLVREWDHKVCLSTCSTTGITIIHDEEPPKMDFKFDGLHKKEEISV